MKRVLLIGGSGQLGTAIAQGWNDCEISAPPHGELPIENTPRLRETLDALRPDVVVNAAAFADVDRCEREPERAFEINAAAVGRAARLVAARDAAFVTLSTDYVFDGAKDSPYCENDTPRPLSVYGASKLAGEALVAQSGGPAFVLRTCGLYGRSRSRNGRRPFVDRILTHAGDAPVRVVADVVASPTYAGDLARALLALLASRAYGLYHAAGAGAVSWYEFAREAARQARVDLAIDPIAAQEWKAVAIRPRYSALDSAKLRRLGIEMPTWRAGIAAYLAHAIT